MVALRQLHRDDDAQTRTVRSLYERPADNRCAPRRRLLKGAVAAFNSRHCSIPCTVRDISDTGARLRSDASVTIPDHFELIIDLDGVEADCEVVWRRDHDLGVRFVTPPRKVGARRQQIVQANATERSVNIRRRPERPQPDMSNRLQTRGRGDLIRPSDAALDGHDAAASNREQPTAAHSDDLLALLLAIQPEIVRICVLSAVSSNLANAQCSGAIEVKPRTLIKYYPRESAILISATQRLRRRFSPSALLSLLETFHVQLAHAKEATLASAASGFATASESAGGNDMAQAWQSVCGTGRDLLAAFDQGFAAFEITGSAGEQAPLLRLLEQSIAGDHPLVASDGTVNWPEWAERRESKRVAIRCPAVLIHGAHQQRVVIRDISATGIGLDATRQIGLGEQVVVQFGHAHKLEGKVMWTADGRAAIRLHRPLQASGSQLQFLLEETAPVGSTR
ncbi:MAG: PilZ domain-containing protein [Hyphomicrobiaceae bacterium]